MNNEISTAAANAAAYFKCLEAGRIQQSRGKYSADEPCCVGAHLAHHLKAGNDFLEGVDAWAQAMGGNRAQAILMLRDAGAPQNPLSSSDWDVEPAEVMRRVSEMETLPALRGADLTCALLEGADLKGADLHVANLRGAKMDGADLRGADLHIVDLRGTDLVGANLESADLRGAKMVGADLRGACLAGADLKGADLHVANLRGADLKGADLKGADLKGANLDDPARQEEERA